MSVAGVSDIHLAKNGAELAIKSSGEAKKPGLLALNKIVQES